jgi:hypothetical protein
MRTSAIQPSVLPPVSTPDDYPVMQASPVSMIDNQAGTKDWPHRKAELARWRAKESQQRRLCGQDRPAMAGATPAAARGSDNTSADQSGFDAAAFDFAGTDEPHEVLLDAQLASHFPVDGLRQFQG